MQIKIFSMPLTPDAQQEEELNHFLRSHRIVDVRREIASSGGNCWWTFCVTWLPDSPAEMNGKPARVDYRTVLDERTFLVFSDLRKIRKELAEKDAVPAYAVFTDAELAEIARAGEITESAVVAVPGVGKKRLEKYGKALCVRFAEMKRTEAGSSGVAAENNGAEVSENDKMGAPFLTDGTYAEGALFDTEDSGH